MNNIKVIVVIISCIIIVFISDKVFQFLESMEVVKEKEAITINEVTNLSLVLKDFQSINPEAKIKLNKDGDKLIVQVTQKENENGLKANYINVIQYTDWITQNIKKDINYLEIEIILPESKVNVTLDMNDLINNDYFDENYIKERID